MIGAVSEEKRITVALLSLFYSQSVSVGNDQDVGKFSIAILNMYYCGGTGNKSTQ